MRERLVAAFVGLTIVMILLYAIPRAYVLANLVRDQEQAGLDRTATLVAVAIEERRAAGGEVDSAYLDVLAEDDEGIELRDGDGRLVGTSDWSDAEGNDLSSTVDVGDVTVTVTRDGEVVDDAVAEALLPLAVLGLLIVILAGGVGYVLARRIARPFQDLATAARGLGTGDLHPDLPDYRVPEARAIAEALTTSGEKLDALLRHERDLAVHASHELRTPVTALRLELEDLALWPETPPAVAAELRRSVTELERLSDAIGELLAASQDLSAAGEIDLDLDALVADTVARLAASGHPVTHAAAGGFPTRLDPVPVVAALELLLPHAEHVTEADRGSHLEVRITGPDLSRLASRDRAADLVAAAGGHLASTDAGLLVRLPKRPVAVR